MKKTLLLLVALISATIAFAYDAKINGIYYNLNDSNQTAEVTSGSNYYSGDITIPEKVTHNSTEYSVTSIGRSAFFNCSSLTSITIPNSVTSIGGGAFYNCSSLTSISIPNSVTYIGWNAFYSCSSLTSITIPNSITSIGTQAFFCCSSLTSITIPNSVTSIDWGAFSGCSSLTSISIPNSVTSIGNYAFSDCESLTSITIPNSITSIGDGAFRGTPWLKNQPDGCLYIGKCLYQYKGEMPENTHIDVNEGTTMICSSAFEDCSSLTSITIPNSVTYIGWNAFYSCSSLTSITIPNSITSIGGYAFSGCSSLTSITIPNSVTSIGDAAFSDCESLTSITIPGSVARLDSLQFTYCISLSSVTILYGVTYIGGYVFCGCSSLTSITIPNSVTYIGVDAFSDCESLTSITIPNSVTSIDWGAFSDCESLTSITCFGTTPPEASNLGANTSTCTLIVPKEAYNNYLRHEYWGQFQTIRVIGHREIKTEVNNSAWGKVTGAGFYKENDEATLTATANSGYRFVKWSDEVTDNPRTVVVTQDSTFTAIFELETYTITTAAAVPSMGNVKVTLIAEPIEGLVFDHWSDGNTENPRTLTLTEDIELYAYFKVAETTNVETSKISFANIYTTNGTLHIEGATNDYHILDAAGRLIYSGNASTLQLPRGIYLITMGGEVEKIVL